MFILLALPSCKEQEPHEKEIPAKSFADFLKNEYSTYSGDNVMTLDNGSVFFADLDNDNIPELFFMFDNYKTTKVMVYSIRGETLHKLGDFEASMLPADVPQLEFILYQNQNQNQNQDGQERILYTKTVLEGGAATHQRWITDTFLTLKDNKLETYTLASMEDTSNGEFEYWESISDSSLISEEEFTQRKQKLLNEKEIVQTVQILQKDWIENFTENDLLEMRLSEIFPDSL